MPFVKTGAATAPEPPAGRMVVDPDKVLQLKKRLEDRRQLLRDYLVSKGDAVFVGRPPGADPCSESNADAFTTNGKAAAEATVGFIKALDATITSLHDTAVAYGLVEEANEDRFRREPR
jgi:hypothetical protein